MECAMLRWTKKLPFRELTIPPIMLLGKLSNVRKHITPFRELTLPHGSLAIHDGVPVARVRGTPREMGRALGTLIGVQAAEVFHSYLSLFSPDMKGDLELARGMEKRLPEWMLEEMRGFCETCELTYDEMLTGQCFLDIHKVAMCSTIAAYDKFTTDGEMLIGRNLDFPSLDIAHEANMVVVYEPVGRTPYATVTWPGFLGALTGLNAHGLAISMMLVYGQSRHEHLNGQPFPTVFRRLLHECAGVRQADDLLATRPYCTSTNLIMADANRTAARLQLHPAHPVVEYATDEEPAVTCTNHYHDRRIKSFAMTWFSSVVRYGTLVRRVRKAAKSGNEAEPIDVPSIKKLLQASSIPTINMQRVIMRPERLDMEVAFEDLGRGYGRWVHLPREVLFPGVEAGKAATDATLAVTAS
jgi:predicted choloylglycine hydrolase